MVFIIYSVTITSFWVSFKFMICANIGVLGQLCTLQFCTPKFYINFKIQGKYEFVVSKDSNWYKSIQTSSHLFIYKVQEVQRKCSNTKLEYIVSSYFNVTSIPTSYTNRDICKYRFEFY